MSKTEDSESKFLCSDCNASFFTDHGLQRHYQWQHGIYCESCPIDMAIEKIVNLFRKN